MGEGVSTVGKKKSSQQRQERVNNYSGALGTRKQSNTQTNNGTSSVVDLDSRKFKSAITRAHKQTDENFHQVASAIAAKAFGYNDLENEFRQIEKEHKAAGSLSGVRNGEERVNALNKEMTERIRRDYGEKGLKAWRRAKS